MKTEHGSLPGSKNRWWKKERGSLLGSKNTVKTEHGRLSGSTNTETVKTEHESLPGSKNRTWQSARQQKQTVKTEHGSLPGSKNSENRTWESITVSGSTNRQWKQNMGVYHCIRQYKQTVKTDHGSLSLYQAIQTVKTEHGSVPGSQNRQWKRSTRTHVGLGSAAFSCSSGWYDCRYLEFWTCTQMLSADATCDCTRKLCEHSKSLHWMGDSGEKTKAKTKLPLLAAAESQTRVSTAPGFSLRRSTNRCPPAQSQPTCVVIRL